MIRLGCSKLYRFSSNNIVYQKDEYVKGQIDHFNSILLKNMNSKALSTEHSVFLNFKARTHFILCFRNCLLSISVAIFGSRD